MFSVLGPMALATEEGVPVQLSGFVPRATLGALVVHSGRVVPASQLLSWLWPAGQPPTARKMLQNAVSRIRRLLVTSDPDDRTALLTAPPGYLLRTPEDTIDLQGFRRMAAEGHRLLSTGDWDGAATALRAALSLWRAPILADLVDAGLFLPEATAIQNQWLVVYEDLFTAELARGRHAEIASELEAVYAANPMRERLCGQLMIARYRTGRLVEALSAFREVRDVLVEDQGIDPSPQLTVLHDMILRHDRRLGHSRLCHTLPVRERRAPA